MGWLIDLQNPLQSILDRSFDHSPSIIGGDFKAVDLSLSWVDRNVVDFSCVRACGCVLCVVTVVRVIRTIFSLRYHAGFSYASEEKSIEKIKMVLVFRQNCN